MKKIKHKISYLFVSMSLIATSVAFTSCESENDSTTEITQKRDNFSEMESFALAVSRLSQPKNVAILNENPEKITDLILIESKDLLFMLGMTKNEIEKMTSDEIISKAFQMYAEENQKQSLNK